MSTEFTFQQFLDSVPEDRKEAVIKLHQAIKENLPEGFKESIKPGWLNYCVPHSRYPAGYHCDPSQPLPFLSLASQKNFIALYHMGMYADPELLSWFTKEYPKHSKQKLDMGKSCIRFKKPEQIPFELLGELFSKVTPEQWIERYEKVLKR